jgi:hypothetical protein
VPPAELDQEQNKVVRMGAVRALRGCLAKARLAGILLILLSVLAGRRPPAPGVIQPDPLDRAEAVSAYGRLPLSFEANSGRAPRDFDFVTSGPGFGLGLSSIQAMLALVGTDSSAGTAVAIRLLDGSAVRGKGEGRLPGTANYFIGNDPAGWKTNVPTFSRVRYSDVYPGVDLVYHGENGQIEYDFVVAAGADPSLIRLELAGADTIRLDESSGLRLQVTGGELSQPQPALYQMRDGQRIAVDGGYRLLNDDATGFWAGTHDASLPLFIDPVLAYSTYLGGSSNDLGGSIAIDGSGNAYITGSAASTNFPTTSGAFQTNLHGVQNAFVAKLNSTGTALVYSTYLGGSNEEFPGSIAVDGSGNAYVTGTTMSTNFPTTAGAFQTTLAGTENAFVTKINSTGTALVYSTYLGGNSTDVGNSIAVEGSGNAYVTGSTTSTNFPTTSGAFQTFLSGSLAAYATKLNNTGSALIYSSYLGGSNQDYGSGIAIDGGGNAYITGGTKSANFPTTAGAFQTTFGGFQDAFVSKLNSNGSALAYSTYLGGIGNDSADTLAVDASGNAYVVGLTFSSDFPTTVGAFQTSLSGTNDVFVTKVDSAGTALVYSTYLGGNREDFPGTIAVDTGGEAYVVGYTTSRNFPTTTGAFQTIYGGGASDVFVSKLNGTGAALVYSTYLGGRNDDFGGGIAIDGSGNAYVTGYTTSTNFPTTAGVFQTTNRGSENAFISKFMFSSNSATTLTSAPNPSTAGQQVTLTATVTCGSTTATGTVTFRVDGNPLATQTLGGTPAMAALPTSSLSIGNHTITAVYNGDFDCATSMSNTVQQVVSQAGAATTLASSTNPSAPGQPVTFTATVTCPNFTPTGTVTFTVDGAAQTPAALSGGSVSFTTSSLGPGNHTIAAAYLGDLNCAASTSSVLTQVVGVSGTTATVTSSQNPSMQGQSVTFTSTVGCPNFIPTGTAVFTVDGAAGTPVTLSGAMASFTTSTLTTGSHSVTVAYAGDANCGPVTSTALTQVVNPAPAPVTEQPVGYGYCYPAANAPPPGAPCAPYTGTGAALPSGPTGVAHLCAPIWPTLAQQQTCIAQTLGNVGGFICVIGCGTSSGSATRAGGSPALPSGAYCTLPNGAKEWVPQGAPSGCT